LFWESLTASRLYIFSSDKLNRFYKYLFLFILPILIIPIFYIIFDPFKVLYEYQNYYPIENQYVFINRDVVSTRNFLNNFPEKNYTSFIFGNSRSIFFNSSDWSDRIVNKYVYHFDASDESIFGIYKKLYLISNYNVSLNNCLVILDESTLIHTTNEHIGHLFIKDYILTGQSKYWFHLEFFKAFLNPKFLFAFTDYTIFRIYRPYMVNLIENREFKYDPITNDLIADKAEKQIEEGLYLNYINHNSVFYSRSGKLSYSPAIIQSPQIDLCLKIKNIFDKHNTKFKIIISPLYDQKKLNPKDLEILKLIFGCSNVFDFSGINSITIDYHNYYETSHYRPKIGQQIMDSIYPGSSTACHENESDLIQKTN
jgi:hypothetical protein